MPRSCAAAQISSTGGSHPVTLEAPVSASRAGGRPSSSTRTTSSVSKVPSVPHSTQRRVADPRPGEQVGVVLDHGGGHHVVGTEPEPVGQVVDGLGGVAHQDHHVVTAGRPPGEAVHGVAGGLVGSAVARRDL